MALIFKGELALFLSRVTGVRVYAYVGQSLWPNTGELVRCSGRVIGTLRIADPQCRSRDRRQAVLTDIEVETGYADSDKKLASRSRRWGVPVRLVRMRAADITLQR